MLMNNNFKFSLSSIVISVGKAMFVQLLHLGIFLNFLNKNSGKWKKKVILLVTTKYKFPIIRIPLGVIKDAKISLNLMLNEFQ